MTLSGVAALTLIAALYAAPQNPVELIGEGGARFENIGEGVVQMRGSKGWLRMPGVFADFSLKAAFRNVTADADGGLVVRSWLVEAGWPTKGYHVPTSPKVARDASTGLLGTKAPVSIVEAGDLDLRGTGEWQQVELIAQGRTITLTINDRRVGVYEIEEFAGEILFVTRKGTIEWRDISVRAIPLSDSRPAETVDATTFKKLGVVSPKLRREVKPNYTRDAMEARVQGIVYLEAVVLTDGTIGPVRVTKGLHPDLDQSAIAAVRKWSFVPGMLNGKPIPTLVEIEMSFTLRR